MARRNLLGRVAALEAAQAPPETLVIQVTRRIVDRAEDGGLVESRRESRTVIVAGTSWRSGCAEGARGFGAAKSGLDEYRKVR